MTSSDYVGVSSGAGVSTTLSITLQPWRTHQHYTSSPGSFPEQQIVWNARVTQDMWIGAIVQPVLPKRNQAHMAELSKLQLTPEQDIEKVSVDRWQQQVSIPIFMRVY